MLFIGIVEFIFKSLLYIFASFMKLILPARAILAWRNWILDRSVQKNSDGSKSIKGAFVWNPLMKYPRNFRCYCGSQHKFKVCCMHRTPEVCSPKEAFANKWAVKWAEKMWQDEQQSTIGSCEN